MSDEYGWDELKSCSASGFATTDNRNPRKRRGDILFSLVALVSQGKDGMKRRDESPPLDNSSAGPAAIGLAHHSRWRSVCWWMDVFFFLEDCWKERARFQRKRPAVEVNAQLLFSLFFWWQFKDTKLNYNCALGPQLDLFGLKVQKLKFDKLWHRKNAHISHKHSQWILCITALEWLFGSFKRWRDLFPNRSRFHEHQRELQESHWGNIWISFSLWVLHRCSGNSEHLLPQLPSKRPLSPAGGVTPVTDVQSVAT